MAPRWRKVVRDLTGHRGRSLLAVLAMAAGVFQITAMLYKYALLQPELTTMYGRTRPAAATLTLDHVSDALVDSVRRVPGVAAAEARPIVMARARVGDGEWVPAVLTVVRDFDRQTLDTFTSDRGAWPPRPGEVLLERTALRVAQVEVGQDLTVRVPGRDDRSVKVAGTAYAPGLPPAWMEHMVPGFIAWDSPLRGAGESAQIRIRVSGHELDEGWIREVADSVQALLERGGHEVSRVTVPTPGRHPHADQMEAFLFLLLAFGILTFVLSALLVAGMTQALMAEQVRQIGILQAIGGTRGQIAGMYLGQVALLAVAALAVGIPPGLLVGHAYAEFAAGILNADISGRQFPWAVLAIVAAAGLLVPVLVALAPVVRGTRLTVREALGDEAARPFGVHGWERRLAALAWLPRPFALSLRTTLVQRGRLALTVFLLACGGAVFMAALNVSSAWVRSVDADFATRRFDLAVGFTASHPTAEIDAVLAGIPEVERAEYWSGASPYLVGPDGVPGAPVTLVGVPPGSRLMAPRLTAGRWLAAEDRDGAVINSTVAARHGGLAVGDRVGVRMNGRTYTWPIVGVARELTPMPAIYVPRGAVLAAAELDPARTKSVRLVTRRHDPDGQRAAARAVERAMEQAGIELSGLQRLLDQKQGILDHLVIIMAVLTMASVIVVFVGALALASTLMLSVVQRTREFGVLGAIGATPGAIARHVWLEALLIGLFSAVLATVLAAPVSAALEAACGRIFLRTPLDFHMSPVATLAWAGLVVIIASVASIVPARRAARLPVREALAHV